MRHLTLELLILRLRLIEKVFLVSIHMVEIAHKNPNDTHDQYSTQRELSSISEEGQREALLCSFRCGSMYNQI